MNLPPDRAGMLLRLGLFLVLAFMGRLLFPVPFLMFGQLVPAVLGTFLAGLVANAIVVRIYERGRLADVGLDWRGSSLREALVGTAAGGLAASLVLSAPLVFGLAEFVPANPPDHPWATIAFTTVLLLFGAMGEEMLFRGYAFQLLLRVAGLWVTIVLTSVLFALMHLMNPNPNALGIVNTVLWGALLGYAFWRTQALWLPIGLHFGWNAVVPLFGVRLSGLTMEVTGYALQWKTGELWSGGAYGPEGSLLTTLVVPLLFFAVRRAFRAADVTDGAR